MASKDYTLTTDWQKITDGTQSVQIQVIAGTMWLRDSPTKPASNAKGHSVVAPQWIGVTPPQEVWVRASGGQTTIIVT